MRHYVPKKNNLGAMSHNLYMQMLYLIRDYQIRGEVSEEEISNERCHQWQAVEAAERTMRETYKKRPHTEGTLDSLHAFFDYAYYSCMFTNKQCKMGAGKRSWNLYRCRFAYLVACTLGLLTDAPENHHGQ